MVGRLSDVVARRAARRLVGRHRELARLGRLLDRDLPRVVYVHGIPGIGKSALVERFARRAGDVGARVLGFDCHDLEPTADALERALSAAIGVEPRGLDHLTRALAARGDRLIVVLDGYEVFRLVDTWMRRTLVPSLPDNVRMVLAARERPSPAWLTGAGWDEVFETLELGPLETQDALEMLHRDGVDVPTARRVARKLQRHPLALRLATAVLRERRELVLDDDALQKALERLTTMLLADVREPELREAVEAAGLVRRVTRPVLTAMCPGIDATRVLEELGRLPFVDAASDGLCVHEAVRPALARYLRSRDPRRYQQASRDAWRQLVAEAGSAGPRHLWRYTADILYLIDHPVVREAFFPSDASRFVLEPARREHDRAIREITEAHEGARAAAHLLRWRERVPSSFHVAIDAGGACAGLHCSFDPEDAEPRWLSEDPVTAAWRGHLRDEPLAEGERALFLRRWLSRDRGEAPCDVQAACWLDIKRLYMEKRPTLRRVYLVLEDFDAYAPAASELGIRPLPGVSVELDGRRYRSAVLDFGPGSVDGWLTDLAAAELGLEGESPLLDVGARELVLPHGRTELTPLEFGLLRYLMDREGQAVSRDTLLRDVWQATHASNVVDAVVATLRRKLEDEAGRIQTVKGVGYRYRRPGDGCAAERARREGRRPDGR